MAGNGSVINTIRLACLGKSNGQPFSLSLEGLFFHAPYSVSNQSNKLVENLEMCEIRVNTHTHTHNYRASIYNKTFNLQWITGINYPGLSLSYDKSSYKYSSSAILSQKRQDIFMVRRYWGAFSAPEYRRFFVSTHNSLKSLLVFKYL